MKKLISLLTALVMLSIFGCAGSSSTSSVSSSEGGGKVDKKQQAKQLNETKASAEEAVKKMYELEKEKEELQK